MVTVTACDTGRLIFITEVVAEGFMLPRLSSTARCMVSMWALASIWWAAMRERLPIQMLASGPSTPSASGLSWRKPGRKLSSVVEAT